MKAEYYYAACNNINSRYTLKILVDQQIIFKCLLKCVAHLLENFGEP